MKLPEVTEAVVDTPITITPAAGGAAQPLISGQDKRWVFSFLLRVRSMGTATYVRVGNIYGQTYGLVAVGNRFGYDCPTGFVLDLSKVFILSDTNDAVLELIAIFAPYSVMDASVIQAVR